MVDQRVLSQRAMDIRNENRQYVKLTGFCRKGYDAVPPTQPPKNGCGGGEFTLVALKTKTTLNQYMARVWHNPSTPIQF